MTTYNKHNPQLANPIIDKLLSTLGNKWADVSYGNDCVASVSRDIPNYTESDLDGNLYDDVMEIYIPNSTEYDFDQEKFNDYYVTFGYSRKSQNFETLEETIKAVKAFESTLETK